MQEIRLKVRCFETGLSKSIVNGNSIFSFEPILFLIDKTIKNKRGLEICD